jgi:hypothetical protein
LRPAQHDDLLAELLSCGCRQTRAEEVDALDVVSQRRGEVGQDVAGADHYAQVGRLIADDVGEAGAGAQQRAQRRQVPRHAAEIQLRHARVLALEPRRLPHAEAARFDLLRDPLDLRVRRHPRVVVVPLVDAPRVGAHQTSLERPQFCFRAEKPQQHRF